jgi:hypothetical protein
MIQWLKLVRSTKRERSPGQLERILADLGPLPEADQPSARALWIAGLSKSSSDAEWAQTVPGCPARIARPLI